MKRIFDICFSAFMLILLSPLFLAISISIILDSRGGVFFGQIRVGKDEKPFRLWKFRTMRPGSEKKGQLTVGARDHRITKTGYVLRKYKIDELPQLWNVLVGDMSMVGPRPEVPKYVEMYSEQQKKVLSIKPGITDYASLLYFSESDLLAKASDPERTYIEEVMPAKLKLNLEYVEDHSFGNDLKIIGKTISRIFS
ncbi:MAG: sugar transferase [Flavobacteriales bacterium]|nr:sugar transferase [Flavobacteriales bacterium]